jgi:hypothetical protein
MKPEAKLLLVLAFVAVGTAESLHSQVRPGESLWTGPLLVSPGGAGREGRVGTGCPTFSWASSWSLSRQVAAYEVRVYELGAAAEKREPALRANLPAGATAWTPELGDCLSSGRYGWTVAAVLESTGQESERRWSKPAVFRVESPVLERQGPQRPGNSVRPFDGRTPAAAPAAPMAGSETADSPPRSITGESLFTPPVCSAGGEMFADVPASDEFCRWIEQFARDGIGSGCSAGKYCPDLPVTRRQIALFLERAMRGTLRWAPAPAGPRMTTVDDQPVNFLGLHTSIVIGADGLPIISYMNESLAALMVAHCSEPTCERGGVKITNVDSPPPNNVGDYTSIAIGADDLPVISYRDITASAVRVAHCNDVACAGGDETISTVDDDPAMNPGEISIAIGADGKPIISYVDFNAGVLKVAHCDDAACEPGGEVITTVDDPPVNSVGRQSSIAIGTDGLPVISYLDETAGTLKVAHCNDMACAGQDETITTVDDPATNSVGGFTSIGIGADGLPVISYYDSTANALKVTHCNDVACEGGDETITTVDDPANEVGTFTSIAIGVDDLPVISYYDFTAGALKVAHCNDAACAGGNETITTVDDPMNNVGTHTSIAIGADGVPVISYRDATAHALKVAHCGTLSCTP